MLTLRKQEDILLQVQGIPGPLGLLRENRERALLPLAASILARYSKAKERGRVEVLYGPEVDHLSGRLWVQPAVDDQIVSLRY